MIGYSSKKDVLQDYSMISDTNRVADLSYCSYMFPNVETFNKPVTILGNKISATSYMFENCIAFDKPVTMIGSNIRRCDYMFNNCNNFNKPIIIPDTVYTCSSMFKYCRSFNQSITIPSNVNYCDQMFYFCSKLNSPITIIPGGSQINCYEMFCHCDIFNQSVTIPDGVTNCSCMFWYCEKYSKPIIIPDSVTNCSSMFGHCNSFNSTITIGNVNDCNFSSFISGNGDSDGNFGNHIYFKTKQTNINVTGMLTHTNRTLRKSVHFNSVLNSKFNGTDYETGSIVFYDITWTSMTNGFYNTAWNVYCYYNYTW